MRKNLALIVQVVLRFVIAASFQPVLRAEYIADTTTITIPTAAAHTIAPNTPEVTYEIGENAVVTFAYGAAAPQYGGLYTLSNSGNGNTLIKFGPNTPGGNGWSIFDGLSATFQGGVFYMTGAATATSTLDITNATFSNNSTKGQAGATSGVFHLQNLYSIANFNNVLFQGNYVIGANGAAVARNNGMLVVTNGTFFGNYAATGNTGVIDSNVTNNTNTSAFTNVLFDSNRAALNAGVFKSGASTGGVIFTSTNSTFTNNWAGGFGGVVYNDFRLAATATTAGFFFEVTAAGGTNNYTFSGNAAGYSASGTATQSEVTNNAPLGPARAKAGGFMYVTNNGYTQFTVDNNVTLNIGAANATDKALDSIASATPGSRILKKGAGDLILNADNSYYQGSFAVEQGRLLLGNSGAKLGGTITVESGAAFGGAGTLQTFNQSDSALATTVTFKAGSTLQIGTDNAISGQRLAFARTGANNLTLGGNVTVAFDLFASDATDPNSYDQLIADQLTANTGVNTLNVTGLGSGTYTLISASTLTGALGNFQLRVNGGDLTARNTANLIKSGNDILLEATLASLALAWTGTSTALWTNINVLSPNWTDGQATAERYFRTGDHVTFDGVADADTPQNRAITIASEGVTVSGMKVEGAADYTFGGGGITVNAASAQTGFTGTTGKLEKSGAGTLTFRNTANNFGRIDFSEGVIAFSTAAQLGSGATDIRVSDNATLRTTNTTAALAFANKLSVDAGKTATLDITGNVVTYSGDLSGVAANAILVKSGTGTLQLAADYSGLASTVNIHADAGALRLSTNTARLGGAVTVASTASLGGIGGYTGSVVAQNGSFLHIGTAGATTGQTLSLNSLTLQGATLQFDLFDDLTSDLLIVDNLATLAGANKIDIAQYKPGAYTIATINAGDLTNLSLVNVTIGGMAQSGARQIILLSTSGNNLIATGTGDISRSMTWTGTGSQPTTWDTTTSNWQGLGDTVAFASGDRVTFDDTSAEATHDINIDGLHATVSDMIVSGTSDYRFSGGSIIADASSVITAAGSPNLTGATGKLIKEGTGTLTLANDGNNNFIGGIDLKGGALVFASLGASGTSSITINTSGSGASIAAGINSLTLTNAITLTAANDTLTFDTQGHVATLAGSINGAGALSISATGGMLTLGGSNSFAGNVTLSGGTLGLGNISALGAANKTLAITGTGAALQFQVDALNITQTITTTDGFVADTLGNTGTISGNISGSGTLTKTGAGTLALTGANTAFSGALNIAAGNMTANSFDALGSSTGGAVNIATGASLEIAAASGVASGTVTFDRALSGGGAFSVGLGLTADELRFTSNTGNTFAGTLNMNRGTLRLDENAAAALAAATSKLAIGADAVVQKTGGAFTINNLTLDGGRLNITLTDGHPGSELLTATTLNTGTGITKIGIDPSQLQTGDQINPAVPPDTNLFDQDNNGGHLKIVAADTVTGSGDVQLTAQDGSALSASYGTITQTGTTAATSGTIATATYSYGANLKNDGIYMGYGLTQLDISNGKTLILDNHGAIDSTLNAVLAGSGGVEISGTGLITLAKQNTYTGETTITSGTLRAGIANIIALSSAVEIKAGAAFSLNGYDQTLKNLTGEGAVLLGNRWLYVDNATDTVFSGSINGGGRLAKTGTGKLTLTHANTHGSTQIDGGTIGVAAQGALGTGNIFSTGTDSTISIEAPDLILPNAIGMGTYGLRVTVDDYNVTFSGQINGANALTLEGTGTVTLSGSGNFSGGLRAATSRVVILNTTLAAGGGTVTLNPATTIEYRNITSGSANNAIIGGGVVEVNNSTIGFGGANNLTRFRVGAGSAVTTTHIGALGGETSAVEVTGGGTLAVAVAGTPAQSLHVGAGSKLALNNLSFAQATLKLSGSAVFETNSVVTTDTPITGERFLIETPTLNGFENITFDPGPNSEGYLDYRNGILRATLINMATNPGKDIAAAYDALIASTSALYSRVSENFLLPLTESRRGYWIKAIGSFADYDGDDTKIGYRENTYGAMLGYDAALGKNYLIGIYVGYNTIAINTDSNATNNGKLPYGGIYAAGRWGGFYTVLDTMIGSLAGDTHRFESVGDATGTYKATTIAGSAEMGFIMNSWDTGVIRPSFSLHYLHAAYGNQDEFGPGAFYIDDFKASQLEGFAKIQVSQRFKTWWKQNGYFDFSLGWRMTLWEDTPDLSARFTKTNEDRFTIDYDKYRRDGIVAGFGLRMMISKQTILGVSYDYELSRDFARHTVEASIRWLW